jgi:hypothetical protein
MASPDDCMSISGGRVFMNDTPILFRIATQKFMRLSMTEAKIEASIMVTQDMLYIQPNGLIGTISQITDGTQNGQFGHF